MRVVLDTNVWVSGLLWPGPSWRLVRLIEMRALQPIMTPSMLDELADVLMYPRLRQRLQRIGVTLPEILSFVAQATDLLEEPERPASPLVPADPDDDVFILCALAGGAPYLVSGDQHLLGLDRVRGVRIVAVQDFLEQEFPTAGT